MKQSRTLGAFVGLLLSIRALAASEYVATIQTSRSDDPKPTHDVLQVEFWDSEERPGYLVVNEAVRSPASYELFGRKGDSSTALEIAKVVPVPAEGPAMQLVIHPKELLDLKKFETLEFRIKDKSVWKFKNGSSWKNKGDGAFLVIEVKTFEENAARYRRFSGFRNHVDTGHNIDGGVLSLELHYEARTSEESTAQGAYLFLFNAKGDFVFPTREKASFFNSLNADLEYVYSHMPDTSESSASPGAPFDPQNLAAPKNRWEPFWDIGISGKYESDQSFDNVNLLVGVVGHVILRNPITDGLQQAILLRGPLFLNPKREFVATIAPLITLRYDYVSHIKDSKEIDTGQNRLTAALFYRLPLARGIDLLKRTGLTEQVFDSDFVAELEFAYDCDKDEFANNTRLTFEILPQTRAKNQPSFILTYAQGKATPTFQHFDAFLAGLKIPF